jgi:hypothetical protein
MSLHVRLQIWVHFETHTLRSAERLDLVSHTPTSHVQEEKGKMTFIQCCFEVFFAQLG